MLIVSNNSDDIQNGISNIHPSNLEVVTGVLSNLDFAGRVIFSFKCCRFSTLDINESDAAEEEETPPSKFKSVALIIDSSRTGKCNSSNRTSSDDEMRGGMNLGR